MSVLTAFYDLERGPVSFDVVTWLVRAMMERDARKCTGLHVVVVPKEDGLGGFSRHWGPHDEHATRWRLWHIVVASCPLARATMTIAASRAQAKRLEYGMSWWPEERVHLVAPIMEAGRKGRTIPILGATMAARGYAGAWLKHFNKPVVTLTRRNQVNDAGRNADPVAWDELRRWLVGSGYDVISLPDAHDGLRAGQGYPVWNPDLRLALYELAAMNVVGNNGPAALLWHSAAPYLRVAAGTTADWGSNLGLQQGEQVPWARHDQRLVYGPDSFETMRGAFEAWAGATS